MFKWFPLIIITFAINSAATATVIPTVKERTIFQFDGVRSISNQALAMQTAGFTRDERSGALATISSTANETALRLMSDVTRMRMDDWWSDEGALLLADAIAPLR